MDDKEILVTIKCLAYNHGKYIRRMLDGCLSQKTNFRYEIIIHDDASTDDTVEIIKEYYERYPNIIVPILQTENQYYKPNVSINRDYIYPLVRGKYLALCEGDDYWSDENKLQIQVDYLESHPECSFVFHDADIVWENGKFRKDFFDKKPRTEYFREKEIVDITFIPTASIVARSSYVINARTFCDNPVCGDLPLMLSLSIDGYGYYINKKMSAYRVANPNSASGMIRNNRAKLEKTHMGHVAILEGFNKITDYRWDNVIKENIKYRRVLNLMELSDAKAISEENLKDIFNKLPLIQRLKFILKYRFNWIYNILRRIRNIICGYS